MADSISVPGNAVQSKTMKGPFARGLDSWMASASCSLPVPVSPSMVHGMSDAATLRAKA